MALPDPDKQRRMLGLALYLIGQGIGGPMLLLLFLLPALMDFSMLGNLCLAAVFALPAGVMYLTVPRLLDRYDPEPWYALLGCLLWGAIAACGFSAAINSLITAVAGDAVGAVLSAPIFEEFFKGLALFGMFVFLRREFDGIVDGIIYATFTAIGFAAVENVLYYANAAEADALGATIFLRGILTPWAHPVFTAMTGIGFGVARETEKAWVRWLAPLFGYFGAVMLHAMWNGSATFAEGESGAMIFLCMLPIWFLFVMTFLIMIIVLVRRRGRIIRQFLEDEVALGNVTAQEVDLVCSAFGLMQARMRHGRRGADFVRAAARLALSKWHSSRAHRSQTSTVSWEFIVPLRNQIRQLRADMLAEQGRQQGRG